MLKRMDPESKARKDGTNSPALGWAKRLQAIAQTGLAYANDQFDIERYRSVRQIAAEILAASFSEVSSTKLVEALAGMFLLSILVLPHIVNVDKLRPQLESSLQSHLGREVHIGNLELSLLAGGARAENLFIGDDPAFNTGSFLQAKSLEVGVSLFSGIFARSLHVTSLTIEEPELVLSKSSSGKWNFSGIG